MFALLQQVTKKGASTSLSLTTDGLILSKVAINLAVCQKRSYRLVCAKFTFPVQEVGIVSTTLYLLRGLICCMLVEPFPQVVADEALVVGLNGMEWISQRALIGRKHLYMGLNHTKYEVSGTHDILGRMRISVCAIPSGGQAVVSNRTSHDTTHSITPAACAFGLTADHDRPCERM